MKIENGHWLIIAATMLVLFVWGPFYFLIAIPHVVEKANSGEWSHNLMTLISAYMSIGPIFFVGAVSLLSLWLMGKSKDKDSAKTACKEGISASVLP